MQMKKIGTSSVETSEIVLGTWAMGGTYWGPADDEESIKAIHRALDCGIVTLDTAEAYNNGYSEKIIGKAIEDRKDKVVISTKVANYNSSYEAVKASCHRSLNNLKRDYIDVYYLHWPSYEFGHPYVPFEETLRAVAELKEEGKIRAVGLSNFSLKDFEQAKKIITVDAYQPPFNILWRSVDDMFPYCMENNISVFPYASVAQGLLTGTISPGYVCGEGDKRSTTPLFQPENMEKAWGIIRELKQMAEKYNKSLVQFVLRWTMQFPGVTAPLVGGRTDKEIEDGIGAVGWEIKEEDFNEVNKLSLTFFNSIPKYKNYFNTEIVEGS